MEHGIAQQVAPQVHPYLQGCLRQGRGRDGEGGGDGGGGERGGMWVGGGVYVYAVWARREHAARYCKVFPNKRRRK